MKLFIAGICGTFMAGIAQLAKASGHEVRGCDKNIYPPMSTLLESENIEVLPDYLPEHIQGDIDQIVVGNALSRGNPLIEYMMDSRIPHTSGPQWLHDNLLTHRRVIAVAGTHGKTTTSSMLARILDSADRNPGFLIGGKPGNFPNSARLGDKPWFVIEADEYDTAFFDKRSKFVHYCPEVAVINNLEFDHADIFDNLGQIQKQFHHLIRIVPPSGTIIANSDDRNVREVLEMGIWSQVMEFSLLDPKATWFASASKPDASCFNVFHKGEQVATAEWNCIGSHNMANALAAIAASHATGIEVTAACTSLSGFVASDRRLQLLSKNSGIYLYEDFAHHPTAIRLTIEAIRKKHADHNIIAILEPRSNTMRGGYHGDALPESLSLADLVYIYQPDSSGWQIDSSAPGMEKFSAVSNADELLNKLELSITPNSVIICMSNGSFDGIPRILNEHLNAQVVQTFS